MQKYDILGAQSHRLGFAFANTFYFKKGNSRVPNRASNLSRVTKLYFFSVSSPGETTYKRVSNSPLVLYDF